MMSSVFRKLIAHKNVQRFSPKLFSSSTTPKEVESNKKSFAKLAEHRFVYPEFLPDPKYEFRNKIREKLEREDMLKRRNCIEIPEFYVGSVLAVTSSDQYAPGKENRFVGICIARTYVGLKATFLLRNIVDQQGIEILYDMYNPTIQSIDVLRLEKRLDDELLYLRDAPPEYSTFPFDMEPEFIVHDEPVRLNPLKVKLKPPPWNRRWELRYYKGIANVEEHISPEKIKHAQDFATPWEEYDLMKQYRRCIPEEDQLEIWQEVDAQKKPVKQQLWKRTLQKAKTKKFF